MSRRLALSLVVLSACALRPRYEELTSRFVTQDAPRSEVLIQVVDRNEVPVPGARIEIGDRNRFKATTDADGIFRLPIEKKYSEENALVVVVLPQGVKGYRLVAPGGNRIETQRSPPLLSPPEAVDSGDAGVTTM
jgi:hypothetical protein